MYHRGIERLQTRIMLQRQKLFFALPSSSDFNEKTLFGYDAVKDKLLGNITLPKNTPFNINRSKSVMWGKTLLVFTDGCTKWVEAYRLNFENLELPTYSQLAGLKKSLT